MQRTCRHVLAGLIAVMLFALTCGACAEELDTIIEEVWVLCYPDSEVNVRENPSKNSFAFGALSCGDCVWTDNKTKGGYLHVVDLAAEIADGWISRRYVSYEKPEIITKQAVIRSNGRVACRKWINGKIKGWITNGETLTVYAMTSEWAATSRGYISSQFLQADDSQGQEDANGKAEN